jgi:hypothetical protein
MADAMAKPSTSLQESILTLLCWDDTHGKIIANAVPADTFEGDYNTIAVRAIEFWRVHRQAPKHHVDDLIGDKLRDTPEKARLFAMVMENMTKLYGHMNVPFVMSQITNYIRFQRIRLAVVESADRIKTAPTLDVSAIEQIWADLLRTSEIGFDAGVRLTAVNEILEHLEKQQSEFVTGVGELDRRFVVPRRKAITAMLGVAGEGKTWFLTGVGRHNIMRRKRIVHLTLEVDAEDVVARYYQSFFAIPMQKMRRVDTSIFKLDDAGRLRDIRNLEVMPDFSFESPTIRMELETRIERMGLIAENLIVKRFPPNRITSRDVIAYLDNLEAVEHFSPDLLLIDAPYLYKLDPRDKRGSIGLHVLDSRAIAVERNIAAVMTHQINRGGAREGNRRATDISEDWSIVATADQVYTQSKTQAEIDFGLARLFVDKARHARDKWECLLTQALDIGQFCLDSRPFDSAYKRILKEIAGDEEAGDEEADDTYDD